MTDLARSEFVDLDALLDTPGTVAPVLPIRPGVETEPPVAELVKKVARPKPARVVVERWTFRKRGQSWCKLCRCIAWQGNRGNCANARCVNHARTQAAR